MIQEKQPSITDTIEVQLFMQPLNDLIAKISYYRRLERVWQLITSDYSDDKLSLEQAAKASGTNKNHLNALLRQTASLTFHQLLIRYRLYMAVSLIKARNYNLLEVGLQTGFGSLNSFERNFRRILGITPKEFKGNYRLNAKAVSVLK